MKYKNTLGFSLVELLVVIAIIAILGVVAYQSFGGVTDKAHNAKKVNDIATLDSALQRYNIDYQYFPPVDPKSDENKWGYTGDTIAQQTNTYEIQGEIIDTMILTGSIAGGGNVVGYSGSLQVTIGSKGTITADTLGKDYISGDIYDKQLGDMRTRDGTFIEQGVGRYVYAVYKLELDGEPSSMTGNRPGSMYNLAYTLKDPETNDYIAKVSGNYDPSRCRVQECPFTLISYGTGETKSVRDGVTIPSTSSTNSGQVVPYSLEF